jgi:LPS export ABC transporter protein LptC
MMAAVALALVLVGCDGKPEKLSVEPDRAAPAEEAKAPERIEISQELRGVRYTQSKGGKLFWELEADSVAQPAEGPVSIERVKIVYHADDGRVTVVTADAGLYDEASHNATLRGNVVVETSDGGSLNCERLQWDADAEMLRGEGGVTLAKGGSVLRGTGFDLSPSRETFKMHQVEGIVHKGDADI